DQLGRAVEITGAQEGLRAEQTVLVGAGEDRRSAVGVEAAEEVPRPLIAGPEVEAAALREAVVVRPVPGIGAVGVRRRSGDPTVGSDDVEAVPLVERLREPLLVGPGDVRLTDQPVVPPEAVGAPGHVVLETEVEQARALPGLDVRTV